MMLYGTKNQVNVEGPLTLSMLGGFVPEWPVEGGGQCVPWEPGCRLHPLNS